jgi:hypothetical protein
MGMDQEQTPHKRRVRYKGKYPRKFEEKYKELQPEKYGDTIAHVIQKGNRRHAYLYYGEGDPGFPEDPAGRDRI